MSQYLLKVIGSNEIVNIVEWDGDGSLIAPSGYEFQPFVTESTDYINYQEIFELNDIPVIAGNLFGQFSGELTGSILFNGKTFDDLMYETKYGQLQFISGSNINYLSESKNMLLSENGIILPTVNNVFDNQNYKNIFDKIVNDNLSNFLISFKQKNDPNVKLEYLVHKAELANNNGFSYYSITASLFGTSSILLNNDELFNSTDFIFTDWHIDFDLGDRAQVGKFYGDFFGNVTHVNSRIERTIFNTSGEYTVPEWAKEITVIAIGAGGGGGGGVALTFDSYNMYDELFYKNFGGSPVYRPFIPKPEIVDYEGVYGGGGGAGGNVKVVRFKNREIFGKCFVTVGKGGRGGYGCYALNQTNLSDEYKNFFIDNYVWSSGEPIVNYHRILVKYDDNASLIPFWHKTRMGGDGKDGGASSFICPQTALPELRGPNNPFQDTGKLTPQVEAFGGIGGVGGFALRDAQVKTTEPQLIANGFGIPSYPLVRTVNHPDKIRGSKFWHPQYASGGPTFKQLSEAFNTYPQLDVIINENGGSGGMGMSMPQWYVEASKGKLRNGMEYDYLISDAVDMTNEFPPPNRNNFIRSGSKLANRWVFRGDLIDVYEKIFNQVAIDRYGATGDSSNPFWIMSDEFWDSNSIAPSGGGGGNGQLKGLMVRGTTLELNLQSNPLDPTPTDPMFELGWIAHHIRASKGGKRIVPYLYMDDDMPLGLGGNGGNSTVILPLNVEYTLPTAGGLYGGGGGGGASFFYDLNDIDVRGQRGADGGDGVVIVIAEG